MPKKEIEEKNHEEEKKPKTFLGKLLGRIKRFFKFIVKVIAKSWLYKKLKKRLIAFQYAQRRKLDSKKVPQKSRSMVDRIPFVKRKIMDLHQIISGYLAGYSLKNCDSTLSHDLVDHAKESYFKSKDLAYKGETKAHLGKRSARKDGALRSVHELDIKEVALDKSKIEKKSCDKFEKPRTFKKQVKENKQKYQDIIKEKGK